MIIVINQTLPGSFEVITDNAHKLVDQDGLLEILRYKLLLNLEFLTTDVEAELEEYRELKELLATVMSKEIRRIATVVKNEKNIGGTQV